MPTLAEIQEALTSLTAPSPLALVLAAVAGALLVATPSVLAMVPVIMGYVAAEPGISRGKAVTRSLAFLVGTATTFGAYGLVFGWAGAKLAPLFGLNGYLVAGVVIVALGLVVLGRVRLNLPMIRLPERRVDSLAGAFVLGLPFGLAGSACPCSMPVVLAMLLYAGNVGSPLFGALLLFVFALVRGMPLLVAGAFAGFLKDLRPVARWRSVLETCAGVFLVFLGGAFIALRFL